MLIYLCGGQIMKKENKWNNQKLDYQDKYFKNRAWKLIESSDFHKIVWFPLLPGQKPEDAKYAILSEGPGDLDGAYLTNPLESWKEVYDYLVSWESFFTRLKLGSKEKWITKEKRFSEKNIKKLDKIIAKKNAYRKKHNPYALAPKEELHVTNPYRLAKGHTKIDPDVAITQTARQYASWTGNFVID